MNELVNKVAESGLVTLNLEDFYPRGETAIFDVKDFLFMGKILKEKDFRSALLAVDWEQYRGKFLAVTCSVEAIVPVWAYMLVAAYAQPIAREVVFGEEKEMISALFRKNLSFIDGSQYTDQRVVIKGCGDLFVPPAAYLEITQKLRPYAKSIMYGEPCSTVPIFKRK